MELDNINEQIFEQFVLKMSENAIGEEAVLAIHLIIFAVRQGHDSDRGNNKFLSITKSPALCFSILEYYKVKKFSELKEQPFFL